VEQIHSHEPSGYACPFCALASGRESGLNSPSDVVLRDAEVTAFVSPKWWEAAPGHVIVIPNEHYENVYALPDRVLAAVYATAKRVAGALRESRGCEGTSMRQHNEPGGGQDVWHFHVHVFPRRRDDLLYERNSITRIASREERASVAVQLTAALVQPGGV
jgi:histidine triad (HIT) family protein